MDMISHKGKVDGSVITVRPSDGSGGGLFVFHSLRTHVIQTVQKGLQAGNHAGISAMLVEFDLK